MYFIIYLYQTLFICLHTTPAYLFPYICPPLLEKGAGFVLLPLSPWHMVGGSIQFVDRINEFLKRGREQSIFKSELFL